MFTHNLQYVSHQILIKSNLLAIPNLFFVTMILFEPDAFKCFNIRLSVINCKLRQCHVKQWKPWFSHAMPLSTTVSFSPYFWCWLSQVTTAGRLFCIQRIFALIVCKASSRNLTPVPASGWRAKKASTLKQHYNTAILDSTILREWKIKTRLGQKIKYYTSLLSSNLSKSSPRLKTCLFSWS